MSMSSSAAGKPSPGGARSIRPRVSHSTSAARIQMHQARPMARQSFVVTDAIREKVRHLAGLGVSQDDIARIVQCSPKTLRKRCRDDLDRGAAEANAIVSGCLFAAAKGGNVAAQIFWLKTRARWRESAAQDDAGADRDAEAGSSVVLWLPDNSRDPELTQVLRDAQQKYFVRDPRPPA